MKFDQRTFIYTSLALLAFAGNSVLCRFALLDSAIDPSSFTAIRLISGAAMLLILIGFPRSSLELGSLPIARLVWPAFSLFVYAICFSFAYIDLDTGTGALVLFGVVQLTMISVGLVSGNKPSMLELIGMVIAFSGLVWLLLPGAEAPSLRGFILMSIAGVAWGFYTYLGKGVSKPLLGTARNFLLTVPLVLLVWLLMAASVSLSLEGVILASVSGALTSGVGYTLWYIAIEKLSVVQSAVIQLLVPVIATVGGVYIVSEPLSAQLVIASVLVLGGVLVSILGRRAV